jgi:hypothetical protein
MRVYADKVNKRRREVLDADGAPLRVGDEVELLTGNDSGLTGVVVSVGIRNVRVRVRGSRMRVNESSSWGGSGMQCGTSLEEVGAALGVSRERARQIEARALDKLRAEVDRRYPELVLELREPYERPVAPEGWPEGW